MNSPISVSNQKLLDEVDMSSDQTSEIFEVKETPLYAVQHIWEDAAGSLTVYIEATLELDNPTDADFTPVDQYSITPGDGNRLVNIEKAGYPLVRVRLDQTGGSGTLTSIINSKAI